MTQKIYALIAGIIFLLVALVHLWRIVTGWDIVADGTLLPMWSSWIALIVTAVLSFYGLRYGARRLP